MAVYWGEKRYYSLDYYLKNTYGSKLYKLSLNGGMTCPNRDGTCGTRGCIFCSQGGSGDFAESPSDTITEQIEHGKPRVAAKYGGGSYIAYFQAFTNTYGPVEELRRLFTEAMQLPDVCALAIATRPDCLEEDKVELLAELNRIKPVFVELGLQTIHEASAAYIRRGYSLSVYDSCMHRLKKMGLTVTVHVIIGLPGESDADILATCKYVAASGADAIKLQLLHVLEGTDLARDYRAGMPFRNFTMEEYAALIVTILEQLPPTLAVLRLTGDGPRKLLLAPEWSLNKRAVLNQIQKEFAGRDTWQGKCYVN